MIKTILMLLAVSQVNSLPITKSIEPTHSNNTCQQCENIVNIIQYEDKLVNKTINTIVKVIETVCERVLDPIGKRECLTILNGQKSSPD